MDVLMRELFATDSTFLGVSYLRISIGASDLDDHTFSYCDLAAGETDPNLAKFDLGEDKKYLIEKGFSEEDIYILLDELL